MATYLQNPNFQSYQFQSYESPVQQIASSIASRTNQWEIAASQVKSAYEQAAGLSLSRGESKEALKEFMVKADDMVRKASRSDLSIGDNKTKALNIFKPLYQDQKLMIDHSLTEFYQQQNQMAENTKLRDGGKEYSSLNAQYMQEKYNEFVSDPNYDVNTLQKHYNEKRGYTPYYNYQTEFDNIVKNCKPNQYSSQSPAVDKNGQSTLYFDVVNDKSLSASKLAGCLSTGLSAKAKTQMGIEGYMAYGKNYNGLATDFMKHSDGELNAYTKEKGAVDGRLQALRDKGSNLTPNEQLEMAQLDQTSKQYGDYITDQLKTREAVAGGNMDFIKNNYEKLAAPLYQARKIQEYSNFYQFTEHTEKLEENNAAMLQYKEMNDFTMLAEKFKMDKFRDAQNFVYDKELEGIRQAGRLAVAEANNNGSDETQADASGRTGVRTVKNADGTTSQVITYPAVNGNTFEENMVATSEATINDRYATAVAAKDKADAFIYNSFKTKFPQYKDSKSLIASTEFQNYIHSYPEHPDIKAWGAAAKTAGSQMMRIEALKIGVEERLRNEIPDAFNFDLRGTRPISLPSGEILSPQRIAAAIMGTDPDITIRREQTSNRDRLGNSPFDMVSSDQPVIYYKGKKMEFTPESLQAFNKIEAKSRPNVEKVKAKRNELFASNILELEGRRNIGNDNMNKKNTFKNRVASSLNVKPDQVVLQESNMTGDVWVQLKDDENNPIPKDPLETLVKGYQVKKDGERYRFSEVEEYSFAEPDSYYSDLLTDVAATMKVKERDLNSGKPVEISLPTQRDIESQSMAPTFKMIIKQGPSGGNMVSLAKKGANGLYTEIPTQVRNEIEAIRLVRFMDK